MATNLAQVAAGSMRSGESSQGTLPSQRWLTAAFQPVDAASSVLFRIGFGLIMAWWAVDYLWSGRVRELYIEPRFHFTYYPFDFVRPWPGAGMIWHFLGLLLLAVAIAAGWFYRWATILFAAGFTYFFLLECTNYQNHYYLIALCSWCLACLPLHRLWSLDVLDRRVGWSPTVPAWCLWLLRFHIGVPYFFGGIAKLHPDWLAGEPMRTHLLLRSSLPVIGPSLQQEAVVQVFVWGGLLFDLLIVPMLLWRPTRWLGYGLSLIFHGLNALLFQIHIFPWFMMFATTLFFEPDWPRRIVGRQAAALPRVVPTEGLSWSWRKRAGLTLVSAYVLFHLVWPFRHWVYPGDAAWTEQGHLFAWRMMLRAKVSAVRYYITDTATGFTWNPSLRPYLCREQVEKFGRDPEMVLQLAHFLADEYQRETGRTAEVRALVLTSLNGRKPQPLIDPQVDLTQIPRGRSHRPWVYPLKEPLRQPVWSVPLLEWEQHVELPALPVVTAWSRSAGTVTSAADVAGNQSVSSIP